MLHKSITRKNGKTKTSELTIKSMFTLVTLAN